MLDQATEGFTLQVVNEDADNEENISMEKLTRETGESPVVRLVNTVIFTVARAARERYPHRNAQFRGGGEVPQ